MARPITLKKENIQTRNRKLAIKAKRRRMSEGMTDFFKSSLNSRFSAYSAAAAAAAVAGINAGGPNHHYHGQHPSAAATGYSGPHHSQGAAAGYLATNPMSQYYGQSGFGHHMASQFMGHHHMQGLAAAV